MGLIGSDSGGTQHHFECRQCGTTVDDETATCPSCGSDEIAKYQVG